MIGAPRPLPLAKPAAIDTAQAARYFGARGEPDEKTMALLEQQLKRLDEASRAESEDIKDIVAEIVPTYKRECKV